MKERVLVNFSIPDHQLSPKRINACVIYYEIEDQRHNNAWSQNNEILHTCFIKDDISARWLENFSGPKICCRTPFLAFKSRANVYLVNFKIFWIRGSCIFYIVIYHGILRNLAMNKNLGLDNNSS